MCLVVRAPLCRRECNLPTLEGRTICVYRRQHLTIRFHISKLLSLPSLQCVHCFLGIIQGHETYQLRGMIQPAGCELHISPLCRAMQPPSASPAMACSSGRLSASITHLQALLTALKRQSAFINLSLGTKQRVQRNPETV